MSSSSWTPERVGKLAHTRYPLSAGIQVSALSSYADLNYRLRDGDRAFVLKLAHPDCTREELELEGAAMDWLARRQIGLRTPKVVRDRQGRSLSEVSGPPTRALRVVNYLPGRLWAEAPDPADPQLLRAIGHALAELDQALEGFAHPQMGRALDWDLARADWMREHLHRSNELLVADAPYVEHALDQWTARATPLLGQLPQQFIHNDANDYNLLVDEQGPVGLLDFGDCVHSSRVFEPAIAACYASFHRPEDPWGAVCDLVQGYHTLSPLNAQELDILLDAVRIRCATSLMSCALGLEREPDNAYLTVSRAGARRTIRALFELSPQEARARLPRPTQASAAPVHVPASELQERRAQRLGPSLSLSYDQPLHIVRGRGAYLYEADGRAYLDCVNNVCHLGHAHPAVVEAAHRQMATLNTNTRYLHETILDYAEALCATMPDPELSVCFFTCSGSEANELALRMARAATARRDVLVLDHAYHGNTTSLVELSPYKFNGKGGAGQADHVGVLPCPDPFRHPAGADCSRLLLELDDALTKRPYAALFAESLMGCGGQILPPDGWLAGAFDRARAHGVIPIADEVQVGFGRVGSHMWGFEAQGARPQIVTLGKPIGNGHPLGAVITTPAIAKAFANGMEYFNTFGGNPVSCAVGMAVLQTLEREQLPARAERVGRQLKSALGKLVGQVPGVAEVRGLGLFLGVELTKREARETDPKAPDPERARAVVQRLRAEGILLSTDGPFDNVLKIKPPICFDEAQAWRLSNAIERALRAS